jgi:hypothetical protein
MPACCRHTKPGEQWREQWRALNNGALFHARRGGSQASLDQTVRVWDIAGLRKKAT